MPKSVIKGLALNYPSNHIVGEHSHNDHQIIHAIKGVMRVKAEGGIWVIPPGRCLWMPMCKKHQIICMGDVQMKTIYIPDDAAYSSKVFLFEISPLMREVLVNLSDIEDHPLLNSLQKILKYELLNAKPNQLYLPRAKDDRINKIGETYLLDPKNEITLSEWAERLSFSHRTLIRKIKTETGMTFREYRRQARILASIGLLFEGQNITNTGLDVGFNTTSSFIQSFKAVTGTTPYKYLKSKT